MTDLFQACRYSLLYGSFFDCFLTLAAPFLPFDGMNEKGLAIALLAVPEAEAPYNPDKIMLNTTTAIRLVLDKAANVEEAIELLMVQLKLRNNQKTNHRANCPRNIPQRQD